MDVTWKELRYWLTQTPVFRHPDFNKLFTLYTDANKKGIGAVLYQKDKDVEADYVI